MSDVRRLLFGAASFLGNHPSPPCLDLGHRTSDIGRFSMLTLSDLHFSYGSVRALNGVTMEFKPGEITCVMGRNGVGKTTLMRTIMGNHRATAGRIYLAGADVTALPAHRRARAHRKR